MRFRRQKASVAVTRSLLQGGRVLYQLGGLVHTGSCRFKSRDAKIEAESHTPSSSESGLALTNDGIWLHIGLVCGEVSHEDETVCNTFAVKKSFALRSCPRGLQAGSVELHVERVHSDWEHEA